MSTPYNPHRHQRKLLRWAIVADSLLIIALLVNYFRLDLFGVVPGNAPHNFSFNVAFFLPMVMSSVMISYLVTGQVLLNWKRLPTIGSKLLTIIMTAPIPILFVIQLIRILRVD